MSNRLGIIGGGQLALYLAEAAGELDIPVAIIAETADATALQRADHAIVGALDSIPAIDRLLDCSDVITFDKEAIPDQTLAYLVAAQAQGRISVCPGADSLLMLKDKALQKAWLQEQNLPTLPFHVFSQGDPPLEFSAERFGEGLVQKARCGGYDGRGVQILKTLESRQNLWNVPSIVEPYLPDCREVSVVTVRSRSGDIRTYPPVSMAFDAKLNSVTTVTMPAAISPRLERVAIALAEKVVTLLDGVGVFAIEMFITPGEELLVNEISPRVHNSGHLTLDACNVSQFEQHVRAVTGLPLVIIEAETPAVMMNILYAEAMRPHCPDRPVTEHSVEAGTSVYWYGKAPGTNGRKMGHINALGPSVPSAMESANLALGRLMAGNSECAA